MKNKYILFSDRGAQIVKGEKPSGAIEYTRRVPTNIPMEFWKLENGVITEMTEKEKETSKSLISTKNNKTSQKLLEKNIFSTKDYLQITTISLLTVTLFHLFLKLL